MSFIILIDIFHSRYERSESAFAGGNSSRSACLQDLVKGLGFKVFYRFSIRHFAVCFAV